MLTAQLASEYRSAPTFVVGLRLLHPLATATDRISVRRQFQFSASVSLF